MGNERSGFLQSGKKLSRVIFGRSLVIFTALAVQIFLLLAVMLDIAKAFYVLFGGTMVSMVCLLIAILNSDDDPSVKLSWSVLVAVFPLLGLVLYTFVRLDLGSRMEKRRLRRIIDASEPHQANTMALMQELKDPALKNLARYLQDTQSGHIWADTRVTYFPLGEDKFQQMLVQLEKAENFIFLEYFSIAPSHMWNSILEILARKAAQGVTVRVLYDGGTAVTYLPHDYPKVLERMGIACRVFAPFQPMISTHYNNRDHRKILVIDGKVAFTGGINLLDRYINKKQYFGHWKDTAVMLEGAAVREFTMMFLQMWSIYDKEPVYEPYLSAGSKTDCPGYVIPYCDSPLDGERVGENVYLDILNRAQRYVYIMTPYLILDSRMEGALTYAARRGVDVRLILPHIPDKKYAFALAKTHYKRLTQAGVKLYEYTPGFIHAKTFLCDDREAVVGTFNLDYRSLYHHFECAAYLYEVPALRDIRADFEKTFACSQQVTQADIQKEKKLTRLAGALLKFFAPLM